MRTGRHANAMRALMARWRYQQRASPAAAREAIRSMQARALRQAD